MKHTVIGPLVMAVFLAVGLLSAAAPPGQGARHKDCSLQTPNGTYLFAYSGFQMVDGQQVPFVFSGQERYDGNGAMTGVNTFSINGAISQNVTYTGIYTVNPDCTGSAILVDDGTGVTQHFDLFIPRDGDAISFVQTDPGVVAAGIERRVDK